MSESSNPGPSRASAGPIVQHLVLRVRDLEKSHDFYSRILGFEKCAALDPARHQTAMWFYRSSPERHHDLALAQLKDPSAFPAPNPWMMFNNEPGIDHIAINYPTREAWLDQIRWMQDQGVEFIIRGDHGMTHSAYVQDPDGHGIEVLYDVPKDAWEGDINEALNFFQPLPRSGEQALEDTTNYHRFESSAVR